MKVKTLIFYSFSVTAFALTGCASAPSPVGLGIYTDVKGPYTSTNEIGSKSGRSCAQSFMGLVNTGDASIEAAKKSGGISKVSSIDYETKGAFPFYGKNCTIVKGE